jgi:poly-gamma-glutamate capsule biosynthesis protein CapA/YwtB (metallophosphatase superfamily)
MPSGARKAFSCFFSGDVMTGRGIDHILRRPSTPALQEPDVQDARTYVELAEAASGPIPRGVDDAYIWGDVLEELDRMEPDARVVNLETTVTRSDDAWPKLINYRMHPANVGCFTTAKLDVCGRRRLRGRRRGIESHAGSSQLRGSAEHPCHVDCLH